MSNVTKLPSIPNEAVAIMERVIAHGDISGLTPEERAMHYSAVCRSVGLNPLTRPFEYITLEGKLTLYARKDCADQLRKLHGVSTKILSRETANGVHTVHVEATDKSGRHDEDIGSVPLTYPGRRRARSGGWEKHPFAGKPLMGESLSNALMKTLTKAKRRVTLSICGLGLLDETEVEDMQAQEAVEAQRGKVGAIEASDTAPEVFDCDLDADFAAHDEAPDEACVSVDDDMGAELEPSAAGGETIETSAGPLPATAHYWPPYVPADGAAAAMATAAGPSSGSPQSSLPAALAKLGSSIMAAKGMAGNDAAASGDPGFVGADLAANVLQFVLKATDPEHIDATMAVYRSRGSWKTLTVAQVETIDAAIDLRKGVGRRRRAS